MVEYKLLIVEDELLARIGLRQLLNWDKLGFVLLPDATDGEVALEVIRDQEPDIILLDLNIPKLNGLQLLRIIKEEQITSQVIIVSCHEEFEMVKEAMKLGAYDYLRKLNLSAKEMKSVLNRCLEERSGEKRHNPVSTDVRYDELVSRRGKNVLGNGQCYQTLINLFVTGGKKGRLYELTLELKRQLERRFESYVCIRKNEFIYYILLEGKRSRIFYETLYQEIKQYVLGELYLGVCTMKIERIEDLISGITLVEQIELLAYYDDKGCVVQFDKIVDKNEHSPAKIYHKEEKLKTSIMKFQQKDTEHLLQNLIQIIREEKYTSINVLQRVFMDILGFFSMTAQEIGKNIEELHVQGSNCHYQRLIQMNSLLEIEHWFLEFNRTFCGNFYIAYKSVGSEILRDVFEYIEEHLSEVIQLNEVAEVVGVSPAYLSAMFKKEMGFNFIEYINMKKVEVAKEKLKQGKMVHMVSEELGYENSTYFSKVFKNYSGVTPSYYRQMESI